MKATVQRVYEEMDKNGLEINIKYFATEEEAKNELEEFLLYVEQQRYEANEYDVCREEFTLAEMVREDNELIDEPTEMPAGIREAGMWERDYKEAAVEAIAQALQLAADTAEENYDNIMSRLIYNNNQDELSIHIVDGREIVWYLDGDGYEGAVFVDNLESVPLEGLEEKVAVEYDDGEDI